MFSSTLKHENDYLVALLESPEKLWLSHDSEERLIMMLEIRGRNVETDVQGFLAHLEEWSEDYAERLADNDDIELYNDHWELIFYFREYYEENMTNPTMRTMIRDLGSKSRRYHDRKAYEKHIYHLFPCDPVHEICKLAGLPLPPPDT